MNDNTHGEERTIPFLRRLVDMLLQNETAIEFLPGCRKTSGESYPGRIVVHDRNKVESEILPRYFNHSSFASLRRQLNYFSFSRIGKDNQHAATYYNDQVVQLSDILTLRRRSVGTHDIVKKQVAPLIQVLRLPSADGTQSPRKPALNVSYKKESPTKVSFKNKKKQMSKSILNSSVPVIHVLHNRSKKEQVHLEDSTESHSYHHQHEMNSTSMLLQKSSMKEIEFEKSIYHALSTSPPLSSSGTVFHSVSYESLVLPDSHVRSPQRQHQFKEDDVLDGCQALLALGC